MLRPERMSRVSVTGANRVLDDVIETIHDLRLVHVTDYDGEWEGFDPGDPIAGADGAAERLVTVRSLQSILDVDPDREAQVGSVDVDDRLESIRGEVNTLDDRREEFREERRTVDERIGAMAPIEALGIDLDLLTGYENLETRVGEGDESAVRDALDAADDVARYELFAEGDAIAVFAEPAEGEQDVLEDVLVGAEFAAIEVPDGEGAPTEYVSQLEARRADLDGEIESVEDDIDALREEHADFLLAAEEQLAIEVEKREAPLSFATTQNAFVAEGWIPTEKFVDLAEALETSVGEHCEVEELERASYDSDGRLVDREPTDADEGGRGEPETAADGGVAVETDGGTEADRPMSGSEPPVVQENPDPVRPFEMLVNLIDRPKYSELDPSVVLFLTFPAFFGFMIGDLGYGILYTAIGFLVYTRFDSDAVRSLGAIALWAGGFTMLFGVLYGEIFGLHVLGEVVWGGHPPIEKGLSPAGIEWAQLWLVVSLLVGLLHMTVAYIIGFVEEFQKDGLRTAVLEPGSWLIRMLGIWIWIFSESAASAKPEFLFTVFNGEPFALGFTGFSATVGLVGLVGGFLLGVLMFIVSEVGHFGVLPGIVSGALESLQVLVNVLSYTRLAAVLLAKAGMAFVVNLLFFGAYSEGPAGAQEFHFLIDHGPDYVATVGPNAELMFPGLVHMGIGGVIGGVLVLVFGHVVVLALGITSAGLQAIRLEYVEFLNKFYEGGGERYTPFGRERKHTGEN
ncbi:V-type ATP synthase subunit I [Halococcus sediminicola]|uniref:V-type ATP synthase subunit I n=1 Tax=Halococcus sediminicola TaxID=1264579 RepID=UPI000AD6CDD5|nr:V-type ATP synthase subunit I [Halococcus sediminicola]